MVVIRRKLDANRDIIVTNNWICLFDVEKKKFNGILETTLRNPPGHTAFSSWFSAFELYWLIHFTDEVILILSIIITARLFPFPGTWSVPYYRSRFAKVSHGRNICYCVQKTPFNLWTKKSDDGPSFIKRGGFTWLCTRRFTGECMVWSHTHSRIHSPQSLSNVRDVRTPFIIHTEKLKFFTGTEILMNFSK